MLGRRERVGAIGYLFLLTWRWFTGANLSGAVLTDATWWQAATIINTQRASKWHGLPRALRAGVRTGATTIVTALVAGWYMAREATITTVLTVAGAVALFAAWRTLRGVRHWHHRRHVVYPLRAAIAQRLGQSRRAEPDKWLEVPPRFASDPEQGVTIHLPQGYDREASGQALISAALDRLPGIREPIIAWHNHGPDPTVSIKARPAPPEMVKLAEIMAAIEGAKASEIVLGKGPGNRIVSVSLEMDSPHFAVSAPSNSGKSVATAVMVTQQMRRGATAIILDIKAESHKWAFGLPNAVVMTRRESIHTAGVLIWREVERRQREVERCARNGLDRPDFPRIWVVAEEMNLTRKQLKEMWDVYREEDPERAKRIPKSSPALSALGNISFAGRSVNVHMVMVAQRLTAASTGDNSGAVRESMGIRYMIKPREATWKMLADGANLPKFLRGIKGRAHVVIDGHAEEVQGAYAVDNELRDLATCGTVTELPSVWRQVESGDTWIPVLGPTDTVDEAMIGDQMQELPEPPEKWITVKDAIDAGILEGNAESIARALLRDRKAGRAPEGRIGTNGYEYPPGALEEWRDNRPRAGRAVANEEVS